MAEHWPPTQRRYMVFVPDVVPHFLLVCDEKRRWSVRDYSTRQVRLLPAQVLGRPVEQIVAAPRGGGCLAFQAPRVALSNYEFWRRLTEELGARFLNSPIKKSVAQDGYPVLDEAAFVSATAHLNGFERQRILCSPRSSDWTTWNAMRLLMKERPQAWWTDMARAASMVNPGNQFTYGAGLPTVDFWKLLDAPEGYDKWRRAQLRGAPMNSRNVRWAMDARPLEGPARVELSIDGGGWLVFAEGRTRLGVARGTPDDPRRNRLVQLADCLLTAANGRPCALWILVRDRATDCEDVELLERYRASPEMFAAELPYHPAEALYKLAQRLTVVRWADVVGPLVGRRGADEALTARVRKELGRRIQSSGAALSTGAGAGA